MDPIDIMLSNQFDWWQRKYYVGHNTFGTAIALGEISTIAATSGMLSLYNSASRTGSSNRNVIVSPLYLKIVNTVATDATDFSIKVSTDIIERYSTGGTALTMNSTFVDSDTANNGRPTAVSEVYFGALTLAAASSEAQIGDVRIRPAGSVSGTVVGDEYLITFGNYAQSGEVSSTAPATTFTNNAKSIVKNLPPVFIGQGASMIMQPFGTGGTNAVAFYAEMAVLEMYHNPKRS